MEGYRVRAAGHGVPRSHSPPCGKRSSLLNSSNTYIENSYGIKTGKAIGWRQKNIRLGLRMIQRKAVKAPNEAKGLKAFYLFDDYVTPAF